MTSTAGQKYRNIIAWSIAGISLLVTLGMIGMGRLAEAGPVVILLFAALGIAFRGYEVLKGFAYTLMIFAAVTTALYYPQYFLKVNHFTLTALITPLIQIIMFGMGTEMGVKDFASVAKMPKAVISGLLGHFTLMPLLGFTLAKVFGFPPEIAAGVVLIGSMPCGMASNVMSYLAKANLALSITLTAIATLLAPFLTPMWMKILGGEFIEVDALAMMWDIIKMVILPIGAGLLFNKLLKGKLEWLDKLMPLVSMLGIAFIIVIITASGRNNLLQIGPALIACTLIHNTSGYFLGYWLGRAFKLSERDCRTIAIEVGMQNGGLASGLAKEMGKTATLGLAPAVFGPVMNITGSILASYWHRRPPQEKDTDEKEVVTA
ncbi:bile acid:sodium symporter family protein [Cytophagaceae bacterium YF14B1]|uniref:Bile acid:sodium symporter family protein n=1 Tax=Xanthocytophaga flava TaxID=3048013 RepID=A0AAE3QH45_9BACT|nr:bile acid:sodium symporter family protein [Xanthocytophaga flavus]MDJ1479272.1 bile acid:sodium symporter family protein [Xanthocytophaga flavus]